ncbi:MAG: PIN domain-containing protein [Ginsengibacter sp.]
MKNVLIDTNIILDFFVAREPFDKDAAEIFRLTYNKKIRSYVSALSYANAHYYIKKLTGKKNSIDLLKNLKKIVSTINLDEDIIEAALNSEFSDFEDALQYYSATSIPAMEIILTRNSKDFSKSKIPVYTPVQFLNQFFSES